MRPSTGLSSVWKEDAPGAGARLCPALDLCLRKLGFLLEAAPLPRLRRVYGDVLAENSAMLQMSAELGFYEEDMGPDFRRVVLDLAAEC